MGGHGLPPQQLHSWWALARPAAVPGWLLGQDARAHRQAVLSALLLNSAGALVRKAPEREGFLRAVAETCRGASPRASTFVASLRRGCGATSHLCLACASHLAHRGPRGLAHAVAWPSW